MERDLHLINRGLSFRTLYAGSARARQEEREWATAVTRAGAEVRTLDAPFERMVIVDRRIVFIGTHLADPDSKAAYVVTHPALAEYIAAEYEQKWAQARPWAGERCRQAPEMSDRARSILRALDGGKTIKQIAAHLDLSERTVGKEVSDLYEMTGTDSQFTLGAWYGRSEAGQ
ncbi:LuxR C-terminal-related transcriptional regulator [Streptomyces buecherae]|uniref:LuxR C-terminal-related transcriptional regulator n=1 Tax=Streptomyces buecherae TaxID=2763006 RepID=UPI00164D850B|nr:LuxR C-terminal-related transcriptional regulator [Streptomyces buecherae]QNJ42031.1 helix-turn-helix domain-containing protein [Streptomyces buecherae]